ncbi:hypothetical protein H5410_040632 [Solanum commersonii]|uniref:Uncharacterized protein n=1 Tax=Solanum commersonii TaxID=4109 RepID=A0A9J5XT36_SOLCO|nr:hypothetical protein H5410_040632 [Solanum commersonii]
MCFQTPFTMCALAHHWPPMIKNAIDLPKQIETIRAMQNMPHTGGSNSIATLMDENSLHEQMFSYYLIKNAWTINTNDDSTKVILRFILSFIF